jgi:hypothetical protein
VPIRVIDRVAKGGGFADSFCQIDEGLGLPRRNIKHDPARRCIGKAVVNFREVGDFPRYGYVAENVNFKAAVFFDRDENITEFRHIVVVILIVDLDRKILPYFSGKNVPVGRVGVKKILPEH